MEILLTAAYAFLFIFVIRKSAFFQIADYPRWILPSFFLLKCISGILLGLLYTHYYTNHSDADTFKFFTDSKFIFDTLLTKPYDFFRMLTGINAGDSDLHEYYVRMDSWLNTSPLYNDNRTMIRLNTFFRFFSLGYYNVHVVFINIISFTGLYCLYKTFIQYIPGKRTELLCLVFLMPSLLFWGSGLLKDGLLITAVGVMILTFDRLVKNGITLKRAIIFFISLFVLAFIKVYVMVLMMPGLIAWYISRKRKRKALVFISLYAIFFIAAFNLYRIEDDFNIAALLFYKQKNFIEIGMQHNATMIPVIDYECSGTSILLHSPQAFLNTLLRPLIVEVHHNPMVLFSALENLLLALLIFTCMIFFDPGKKPTEPLVIHSLIFVVCLFVLIALITPVLGAIVRYRIIGLPFLSFALLYYFDRQKLVNKINRKRK